MTTTMTSDVLPAIDEAGSIKRPVRARKGAEAMTAFGSDDAGREILARRLASTLDREPAQASGSVLLVEFTLESDTNLIPATIDRLREIAARFGLFDERTASRVDLALHETLVNGIYHGNLELSSDLRQDGETAFHRLAARRRFEAPYCTRRLFITVRFSQAEAIYVVRDEGPGFDPLNIPDPFDPMGLERIGGRGLLLIRSFMDSVSFNALGNEITLTKARSQGAECS